MDAKDLRERSTEDLRTLRDTLTQDLFSFRMKNAVNQLDDTSLVNKTRRDIARIEGVLRERHLEKARQLLAAEKGSES